MEYDLAVRLDKSCLLPTKLYGSYFPQMKWGKIATHDNKYLTHTKMFHFLRTFCKDVLKLTILSEHIQLNKIDLKETVTS